MMILDTIIYKAICNLQPILILSFLRQGFVQYNAKVSFFAVKYVALIVILTV